MKTSESASSRWARVIEEQRAGGLSIAEFCRRRGISPPSFYVWRRRLGFAGVAGGLARAGPAFVEVKVGPRDAPPSQVSGTPLELVLRSGLRVQVRRGFDGVLLRELLASLEPPEFPEASA